MRFTRALFLLTVLMVGFLASFAPVVPQLPKGFLEQVRGIQPLVGRQQLLERPPPVELRFSRCDSRVYFCPLMNRRSLPLSRAYSRLRTVSSASPRCPITWNLSNKTLAWGALRLVELRNAFHMSITAS